MFGWVDLYFPVMYMLESAEAARDVLVISFKSMNENFCVFFLMDTLNETGFLICRKKFH